MTQPTSRPKVVIIGAGFGGLSAARALRDAPVDVTLVDKRNYHLFQPLLYQVAMAGLSPAEIAVPIRSLLSRYRNVRVLHAEVDELTLPGDPLAVEDVELHLPERRRDLVLDHLDARLVADHLVAFLDGADTPDVEPHR